ncbi:hypothetical protein POM88_001320 [Heracleum sosnowskyi]|uniref:Retrotransposon gag domain-containing protein n=1 Tax=Heracleum sosnowskyi TaxID=360622 RepID=A0AAD8N4W4_9APIA|nr:hypothetical protein POM88_001320 [Heracleum sosnowskyi]
MPPRRMGTRARPANPAAQGSVNQGDVRQNFHNEEENLDFHELEEQNYEEGEYEGSGEDNDYNEFDDQDYDEEEYESTQNVEVPGGNPMDQFMHLLRQNLNQHPPPPPPGPNTAGHSAFKAFKSLRPPEFQRSADPVEARAWLKEMEKSFEILGIEEAQETIFATYLLKGEANYWWESKRNLETDAIITWARFSTLFLEKYFPVFMEAQMERKFLELKQDNMTVAEYEAKFTELSRFMPEFVNTDLKRSRRFQQGLKQWIQNRVAVLEITDYASLVQKATIVESGSEQSQKGREEKKRKFDSQGGSSVSGSFPTKPFK